MVYNGLIVFLELRRTSALALGLSLSIQDPVKLILKKIRNIFAGPSGQARGTLQQDTVIDFRLIKNYIQSIANG